MFINAETTLKNAILLEKSLKQEFESAKLSLEEYKDYYLKENRQITKQLEAAYKRQKVYLDEIKYIKEVIAGTATRDIVIKSPISGISLPKGVNVDDVLRQGEPIIQIHPSDSLKLVAWVPEKFKYDISVGQEATVYIAGEYFEATVTKIYPSIRLSPPELRIRGVASKNMYFFHVVLETKKSIKKLFPGSIGKVIFK